MALEKRQLRRSDDGYHKGSEGRSGKGGGMCMDLKKGSWRVRRKRDRKEVKNMTLQKTIVDSWKGLL
jgi:hypothetical protein